MGVVYLAVRADQEFEMRVALKLLPPGAASEDLARRFRTERQILAVLDHPNIARLLDGGTTTEGQPFLVMEYVEGEPIDRYCDSAELGLDARLRLFRDVCAAVHFAHQNLVVHRDLKPANILVTPDGTPKLLDFGIAKLLDPALFPSRAAPDITFAPAMTPDYASPEQLLAEPVTTASDVYSLGVLLYRLLTGHLPRKIDVRVPGVIVRALETQDPPPPSSNVAEGWTAQPERWRRSLRGDLDAIVLTALRREPRRRYSSVEGFSEDLRNHLRGLPVTAVPDTLVYRAGKFLRRHRLVAATSAMLFSACLGFGTLMAVQRHQTARERDAAEVAREEAERVTGFLVNLFEANDPDRAAGRELSAKEILGRGAERLSGEIAGAPRARLMQAIGTAYWKLGEYEDAAPFLEGALEIRRADPAADPAELADSLRSLGELRMEQGDHAGAEALLREALERSEAARGREHALTATVMRDLARAEFFLGGRTEAEALARESLDIRERVLGPRHPDVVDGLNLLATFYKNQGKPEEAEPLFERARTLAEDVLGPEHSQVAAILNNLANLYLYQNRPDRAEPLLERSVAISERLFGPEHARVGIGLANLANVYQAGGRLDRAIEVLARAEAIFESSLGPDHPNTAASLHNLAGLHRSRG
ncbi:MAG: serine/threonine-protein kinase, partial [Acidobacteriota bacterium]